MLIREREKGVFKETFAMDPGVVDSELQIQ